MLRKAAVAILIIASLAIAGMTINTPEKTSPQTAVPAKPVTTPQNELETQLWFHNAFRGEVDRPSSEPPNGEKDAPPPFGTVLGQWTVPFSGQYSGAGITWMADSNRFYCIDQGASSGRLGLYSFNPTNPTGTWRRDTCVFPNLGGSTQDIPWGIVWDPDSNCFWVSQILDGSITSGCYFLRFIWRNNRWEWRGTTADSWRVDQIMSTYWIGGITKRKGVPLFWCTAVGLSNGVCYFNPYTKTFIRRLPNGVPSTSERGCASVDFDSVYVLTCGWNEGVFRKRDSTGTVLQQVTGSYYDADWEVLVPSAPNPTDTVVAFLMCNDASNTLKKISLGMTWGQLPRAMPYDVAPKAIIEPPSCLIMSGYTYTPTAVIKNLSHLFVMRNIAVRFTVDSLGTNIYDDAGLIDSLLPQEEETLSFSPWTPMGQLWSSYNIKVITHTPGDMNPKNDTLKLMGLVSSDTMYSNGGGSTPSIDGYLNFAGNEWRDAYFANISNVAGFGATPPQPFGPDAAYMWVKHDNNNLYLAFAFLQGMMRNVGDQIGFYLDENGNGQWESDMSEGNYWFWINASNNDEVLFRWHRPDTWGPQGLPVPGAQCASGTFNGYLVFEVKLPFGVLPYQVNMNPSGSTGKLFVYMMDDNNLHGWWPVGMHDSLWRQPMYYGTFILRTLQTGDVGVKSIDAPRNARPGDAVVPKATWKNFGTTSMNFTAYYLMNDPSGTRVYTESQTATLAGGAEVQLTFPSYVVNTEGDWAVKCSTVAGGDVNPANDIKTGTFRVSTAPPVTPGWVEVKSIPGATKDGAFLAFNPDNGLIYAARGNKSGDFYAYDPNADSAGNWTTLTSIPATEGKLPAKGANGCYGDGYVYATIGNNTQGFLRYSVEGNAWEPLTPVPLGASGKKVKGGTDLVYVDGYVYLLKGYKTDFFRYNVAAAAWESLPSAPAGARPKWDKGSWLVWDGANTLYAHKAKYGEMWAFDLTTQQWGTSALPGMPTSSSKTGKNKKSKDGADGAYYNGYIYALKGGNTCEWWRCEVGTGTYTWTELDPMPEVGSTAKKKRVKAGGALAGYGANPIFFALKGGKTQEFWRYFDTTVVVFAAQPERSGVMAEQVNANRFGFSVAPNPVVKGYGLLSYSVPQQATARLTVYDVTGRDVMHLSFVASGTGTRNLDLRSLAAGVYLVKFESAGYNASQKLIVR